MDKEEQGYQGSLTDSNLKQKGDSSIRIIRRKFEYLHKLPKPSFHINNEMMQEHCIQTSHKYSGRRVRQTWRQAPRFIDMTYWSDKGEKRGRNKERRIEKRGKLERYKISIKKWNQRDGLYT